MKTKDRARIEAWLRTPESDEPVPDFVERELEEPFEIDLSEWVPVKPSPDFAERVVREVFGLSPDVPLREEVPAAAREEVPAPPVTDARRKRQSPVAPIEGGAKARVRRRFIKPGPQAASSAGGSTKDPPRPGRARPAERREPAASRR